MNKSINNQEKKRDQLNLSGVCVQIGKARNRTRKSKQEVTVDSTVSPQLFSKFENGENLPSLSNFVEIAKQLDVPADALLQDCHKDFIINAIDWYLSRIDVTEANDVMMAVSEAGRK